MDNFSLEVVSLTRRTINHSVFQKKRNKFSFRYVLLFMIVNIVAFSAVHFVNDYRASVASTGFYSQQTNGSILDDLKSVIFASADNLSEFNEVEDPELLVPVIAKEFVVEEDGSVSFVIDDNIMVVASAKGVVVDSGILATGGKFVEIKHSKHLSTKYENIEIAGVVRGDVVKAGQDVGTSKTGNVVKFSVFYDGEIVSTITIENNMVVWQEQS